jgi:phosphohistidine phosphatase SixA
VTSVLVRHASAGDRDDWAGDDRLRPLDARGHRQAIGLAELLGGLELRRVVSSPYVRCVETVEPLAAVLGVPVERDDRLAEGMGRAALELLQEEGVVCCTHGDVVGELLGFGLKKGAAVIVEDGQVVREIRVSKGKS